MKIALHILFLILTPLLLKTQNKDSIKNAQLGFITDQMENLSQVYDSEIDFSDMLEEYLYYYRNPINLNGEGVDKLAELYLLNDFQIVNLRGYIAKYKSVYSLFELKYIAGFDQETIERIRPFVVLKSSETKEKPSIKKAFKYGRHKFIGRYSQILEPALGFRLAPDSALSKPGSNYLGKGFAYYIRYGFNHRNKLRFGFTLERDAGEVISTKNLTDSIQELIQHKTTKFVDFHSAFAYFANKGILKKAIVGDYHLEFGQGLTMWSGLAFGKSSEAIQIKRFGSGIRPNTSANENRFLRGCATTLGYKAFSLSLFYSNNNIDATTTYSTAEKVYMVNSFQESGKHRTLNEILSKDALNIQLFGGRITYRQKYFTLGITSFHTRLDALLTKGDEPYKLFNPEGSAFMNYGFDFVASLNKVNVFGELSRSANEGMAGLIGINVSPADRFLFTLFYHNYGSSYHNLFANPFSESSSLRNEEGFYFGFKVLIAKSFTLNAYIDHFRFPWLKYRTDGPSTGRDYLAQLNVNPHKSVDLYLRYRYREKQENHSDEYQFLRELIYVYRHEIRINLTYAVFNFLILKNRIEYINFHAQNSNIENGYVVYQDILLRSENFPLELTIRYCFFDTEGYNSRTYTYENDLLYAFSVPSFFGKGQRYYLMVKYKLLNKLHLWFRIAQTNYQDRHFIGNGADEIEGNKKTEIKFQMVVGL